MSIWKHTLATALYVIGTQAGFTQTHNGPMIYGAIDLSVDAISKSEGNVQGTVFSLNGMSPLPNSVASPSERSTRVSTGLSEPSYIGFRHAEDLGGGWQAKWQLEATIIPDAGGLGADERLFGRMAWLGMTTPVGEFRAGRQPASMLAAYHLNSLANLGSTDLLAAGATSNTLQTYQDNMLSYSLQSGRWVGQLSYSPNAGVAPRISAARAQAVSGIPAANESTGQIVGGATAAVESPDGRGRATGGLAAYLGDEWRLLGSFHRNEFNATAGLVTPQGAFVPLFQLKSYRSWMVGAKQRLPSMDTELGFNMHRGEFKDSSGMNPKIQTLTFAVKHTVGQTELIGQVARSRFVNFTRGKDTAIMLGVDHKLSKRTVIYVRAGQLRDERGQVVTAAQAPVQLAGGPAVLLVPLGALEIPYFSGAGANMDATTRLIGVGIRHSF